ncbi:MAG: T9SS type A sorting domain-containing protein [Flavobacteriales bacterium]|nr:T9SS type A sorting domain-containing protein [Flavobacteriales bacterium]MCB9449340.1 T9SS type A sorting domain-containing protein [Flavobacteriales bacterium]
MKANKIYLTLLLVIVFITDEEAQNVKSEGWRMNNHSEQMDVAGNDYLFSYSTSSYVPLTGATNVNQGEVWDDPEYKVPIGFTFKLYDADIDTVYFGLGLGGLISTYVDTGYHADYLIVPLEVDLVDRGVAEGQSKSPISYALEGNPGSRIFKLETKNAGFWNEWDALRSVNDSISFQMWLYEGSNDIEFHYGGHLISDVGVDYDGETGPLVGLTDENMTNAYLLTGNTEAPMINQNPLIPYLLGTPPEGTIFRFARQTTGLDAYNMSKGVRVHAFPNPATTQVTFELAGAGGQQVILNMTDVAGHRIRSVAFSGNRITIDRQGIPQGIYLYTIFKEGLTLNGTIVFD